MPRRPATLVLVLTLLVGGCAGSATWYSQRIDETFEEARANNAKMANLRLGQKREEVLQVMGPPARSEAFRTGDKTTEFLYYRTKGWEPHPWAAAYGGKKIADRPDQFTAVTLENGVVTSWGPLQAEMLMPPPSPPPRR